MSLAELQQERTRSDETKGRRRTDEKVKSRWVELSQRAVELQRSAAFLAIHCVMMSSVRNELPILSEVRIESTTVSLRAK